MGLGSRAQGLRGFGWFGEGSKVLGYVQLLTPSRGMYDHNPNSAGLNPKP